jgi:hypothetical protein
MRVLQAHARLSFKDKQYEKCVYVLIFSLNFSSPPPPKKSQTITEMLCLCPGDNLAQQAWLGSVLNHLKRYSGTMSFMQVWLEANKTDGIQAVQMGDGVS